MTKPYKTVCKDCGWRGLSSERLEAQSPFADELIHGCPYCIRVDCFLTACDEPGCWSEDECGTPTPDGYRRTCCEHMPDKKPT